MDNVIFDIYCRLFIRAFRLFKKIKLLQSITLSHPSGTGDALLIIKLEREV
jgi:hypothetical protein